MKALILVDLQNDFVAPGALPVPGGGEVVEYANEMMKDFPCVVATQDWHPFNHLSFASQHPGMKVGESFELEGMTQIAWPDHCIQETEGSAFLQDLHVDRIDHVVRKGMHRNIDSYSGFFDNGHRFETDLARYLQERGVDHLYIMGLATDYCVRFTALDARSLGWKTTLLSKGCRGVELKPGDIDKALLAMRSAGVEIL